jgi:hypothetical protein
VVGTVVTWVARLSTTLRKHATHIAAKTATPATMTTAKITMEALGVATR